MPTKINATGKVVVVKTDHNWLGDARARVVLDDGRSGVGTADKDHQEYAIEKAIKDALEKPTK